MKILKRFVSWTVWGVITLNLLLMSASHIPAVQQYIGSKTAHAISDILGTQVSIGRVDLGFLNRIIIDDIRIYDQKRKPMVYVSRLSTKIDLAPLADGRISISSAQLFGARLTLSRQHAQDKHNFQFVLDSLAPKDTSSHTPLDLRVNSFILRRSSISYDQYDLPRTPGVFNPSHLLLARVSANVSLKALTDDSLNVAVKRLSFFEQSGLTMSRINFHLEAGRQNALLSDLLVQMPSSTLTIDTLTAHYQVNEKGLKPGTLSYSSTIHKTSITPSDLRCFMPALKNYQRPIDLHTEFSGTDSRFNLTSLNIVTREKDIDILANGWLQDWQSQPSWHLQMGHVNVSENSLDFLTKTFHQLPKELLRLGSIMLTGELDGTSKGDTSLRLDISSGAGDVQLQAAMNRDKTFTGDIIAKQISLQQLLADDRFGALSTTISLSGQLKDKQKPDISAEGNISQFDYNGYSYSDITLKGSYQHQTIAGTFSIDDPNIQLKLDGEMTEELFEGPSNKSKNVKMRCIVEHLAPAALKLSDRWGDAAISASINADLTARTLNDARGDIRISQFRLAKSDDAAPYLLDNLLLTSGFDEGVHYLTLKSDFADGELRGHFDYNTLKQSLTRLIASKLPTLPGLTVTGTKAENDFSLRLIVSKTDWLRRFLGADIQIRQPLSLEAQFNDYTEVLTLNSYLPDFAYNGSWYSDAQIHVTSPADTLKADLQVTKLMDNGHHLKVNLLADASNNKINTSLRWDNEHADSRMSGLLNSIIELYRNLGNKPEAHVRFMPSHIILNNSTWNLEPSDVLYSENNLIVDHFSLQHGKQHIIIDGIASKLAEDTLTVDLNGVEVGYILDLVNFHSVEFSGKASGRAQASSLFGRFSASADLQVDEFKFERGRMGTLYASAEWNQDKEQIDIHATADDGPEATTRINGFVSPVHNTIDLAIDGEGTYIDFMHNFTKSFLSHITGHAEGGVRLAGTLDNINLTGKLIVDGEATVTSLNTTYQLRRDTVIMIPDEIMLNSVAVYDRNNHTGYLSGGIHHQHLTNLTFDLYVDANDLLAYDFNDFGESNFYGTVYATGNVAIHGRPNEIVIDCDVVPEKNTVFVYNAANPDAISRQEFIEWVPDGTDDSPESSSRSKKSSRATDTDIYVNFLINCNPDATIRLLMDANTNDYINLNGEGAIRATFHNKGPFNMFGTYTVNHGTYGVTIQNIIKKNFTFNQGGSIVFGGDPYHAALNLQAVYTVNGVSLSDLNIGNSFSSNTIRVNCLMNISGQPNAPRVDFDLEMPNVNADEQQMVRSVINGQQEMNQQVVYLLGIGRFYNQGANNNSATGEQTDRTSLAMQSFLSGTLSTQINSLLNQIIKNDNWNFGANISTGNEGWHNAEYEGIINGRLLNNRLLFNGQFGYRDNATRANPSFIGDFDLQYLLFPNGNLALKVYNQTNDRYFTKSSLNTQGIGIIMKKDFNGFRDLFTSQKKRKKKTRK